MGAQLGREREGHAAVRGGGGNIARRQGGREQQRAGLHVGVEAGFVAAGRGFGHRERAWGRGGAARADRYHLHAAVEADHEPIIPVDRVDGQVHQVARAGGPEREVSRRAPAHGRARHLRPQLLVGRPARP